MAVIMIPVEAMDERCAGCKSMELRKTTYYGGDDVVAVNYNCEHIHMCTYIRNRIVRNMKKEEAENAGKNDTEKP